MVSSLRAFRSAVLFSAAATPDGGAGVSGRSVPCLQAPVSNPSGTDIFFLFFFRKLGSANVTRRLLKDRSFVTGAPLRAAFQGQKTCCYIVFREGGAGHQPVLFLSPFSRREQKKINECRLDVKNRVLRGQARGRFLRSIRHSA